MSPFRSRISHRRISTRWRPSTRWSWGYFPSANRPSGPPDAPTSPEAPVPADGLHPRQRLNEYGQIRPGGLTVRDADADHVALLEARQRHPGASRFEDTLDHRG